MKKELLTYCTVMLLVVLGLAPRVQGQELRELSDQEVQELLEDPDYIYGRESFYERRKSTEFNERDYNTDVKNWLKKNKKQRDLPDVDLPDIPAADFTGFSQVMKYLLIALFVGVVVYALIKHGRLTKSEERDAEVELEEDELSPEDIEKVAFESHIDRAVAQGDYRKAVRLLFLDRLKVLSKKSHIQWKRDKTNSDYSREIELPELRTAFDKTSLTYEYVWYGEFQLDADLYSTIEKEFKQLDRFIT